MRAVSQVLGLLLIAGGGWLLVGPLALVGVGVVLVLAPEVGSILELRRLTRAAAAADAKGGRS